MTSRDPGLPTRSLSYGWFAAIVIAYLAIIKGVGYLASQVWDTDDGLYTTRDVVVQMWVPLGAALLFTYAVVAALRWWDPVLRERHPVQRWVWAVPVIFAVCIAVTIDYADLFDKSLGYILALLVATQFVGWGEEGMFRGIGVTTLRGHGLTEGKVALWSSTIFGAVHISNALTGDVSKALPQAIAVSFAGYFFYLMRRVSGGNVRTRSSTACSTSPSSRAPPSPSTKAPTSDPPPRSSRTSSWESSSSSDAARSNPRQHLSSDGYWSPLSTMTPSLLNLLRTQHGSDGRPSSPRAGPRR